MKLPSTLPHRPARPRVLAASPLALSLSGCFFDGQTELQLPGYIEADTTSVASPVSGTMAQLSVKEGQLVKPGDMLYLLESQQEQARLAEAESNLKKSESLLKKNFVSETQVDNDRTNVQLAEAQVEDARAALRVAKEGARSDEQAAAQAQTAAAKAGDCPRGRRDPGAVRAPGRVRHRRQHHDDHPAHGIAARAFFRAQRPAPEVPAWQPGRGRDLRLRQTRHGPRHARERPPR